MKPNYRILAAVTILSCCLASCGGKSNGDTTSIPPDPGTPLIEVVEADSSPIDQMHGVKSTIAGTSSVYLLTHYINSIEGFSVNLRTDVSDGPADDLAGGYVFSFAGDELERAIAALTVDSGNVEVVRCPEGGGTCAVHPASLVDDSLLSFSVTKDQQYYVVQY